MTVHGSKGLEADFGIVLGLEGGKYGFPSNIEDDLVIDLVLSDGEEFEQAEERRLFSIRKVKTFAFQTNRYISDVILNAWIIVMADIRRMSNCQFDSNIFL